MSKVKLIAMTKPVDPEIAHLTPQELITYIARVSNPSNQLNLETAPNLIRYCLKKKHISIFEQVDITMEIETSRAISAQMIRHKSFSVQEFSQRYQAVTECLVYSPRRQDLKNRQNSTDDLDPETQDWFLNAHIGVNTAAIALYEEALRRGVSKESARVLLPLSAKTRLYFKGSLRSWIHYIEARTDVSTQLEHREIAEACKQILIKEFPDVALALDWIKPNANN